MATITDINDSDLITNSNEVINNNFDNLNNDKIETSYLDTDTTLAANSDSKIATQKAVKAYVDAGGNVNASTTAKGIVEEATSAEMIAGTAAGGTGARLFLNPSLVAETGTDKIVKTKSTGYLDASIIPVGKVNISTTEVTLTDGASGTETTLFSATVPGGTLGTNNAVRLTIIFSVLGMGTSGSLTLRLKYNATVVELVVSDGANTVTGLNGTITGYIVADGATNAQKCFLSLRGTVDNSTGVERAADASVVVTKIMKDKYGTGAVDSTANQTISVTAQYSSTEADQDLTAEFCIIEKIA